LIQDFACSAVLLRYYLVHIKHTVAFRVIFYTCMWVMPCLNLAWVVTEVPHGCPQSI